MVTKRKKEDKPKAVKPRPQVKVKDKAPQPKPAEAAQENLSQSPSQAEAAQENSTQGYSQAEAAQENLTQGALQARTSKETDANANTPSPAGTSQKNRRAARGEDAPVKKKRPTGLQLSLACVLLVIFGVGAFLIWSNYFRYDDKLDIQGQWKIEGSTASIVITDSEIRLTDSVTFNYELNPIEKTIKYTFSKFSGQGTYFFSPERDVLTLTDVAPASTEVNAGQSMRLLKVSNEAVGEPQTANNNVSQDAQSNGAEVVSGEESAQQAEKNDPQQGEDGNG